MNRSPSAFPLYSEHAIKLSLRVEEGTTGGYYRTSAGACPRYMHYPQWHHKPCKKSGLEITFLSPSQHRNHIFQAVQQCPSAPYNLCSATCQNHRSVLAQANQPLLSHLVGCNYPFSNKVWTPACGKGSPYKSVIPWILSLNPRISFRDLLYLIVTLLS